MARPIVIAYHLIWTGYGWWLPNDPRGSGSEIVRNDILKDLGELHFGRKKLQPPRAVVKGFHILIRKHEHSAETMMECLRSRSADRLHDAEIWFSM